MRRDVQEIFRATPTSEAGDDVQCYSFSGGSDQSARSSCRILLEIYVDDEAKLTLHGLQQYYIKLDEKEKNRKTQRVA